MKVLISIVSFNTKDILKNFLEKLLSYKYKNEIKIWVLDNKSEDGSAQMLEGDFKKEIHLIKNNQNTGFAKGHNKLIEKALEKENFEYIILINPDTKLDGQVIDQMVEFMEENPNCGVASCKILNYDESLQSNGGDLPFGIALFSWLFNLEFLGNLPNFHRSDPDYYKATHQVGWVGGTFMVIKKEVFDQVRGFNEDYFMYFEDVEFCQRVKKAGFQIMINPEVEISHLGGASSKDPRFRQWRGEYWGVLHFYKKQFGIFGYSILKFLIYIAMILRILAFSLIGKFSFSKTYGKILFTI